VLVLVSHFIGPAPMELHFWPSAAVTIFVATLTAGVLLRMTYLIFAMTLYALPPRAQ
jgi:Ca2+:H+ antiporter